MKISFDFDSTLSREDVQEFATELVNAGHEVWIVTSRYNTEYIRENKAGYAWEFQIACNHELFRIADKCGIKKENIKFTNMESKSIFLKDKGFAFHMDDDDIELMDIVDSGDKCEVVSVFDKDWRKNCEKILSK